MEVHVASFLLAVLPFPDKSFCWVLFEHVHGHVHVVLTDQEPGADDAPVVVVNILPLKIKSFLLCTGSRNPSSSIFMIVAPVAPVINVERHGGSEPGCYFFK